MNHVVIGTAGHVDHGKTALVQALTGVDTDRWEEEKRRGITIDLGFAQLQFDQGTTASIVDVPGHEDFVRNMVAGATGIDIALLVVAADEGVMPQTREHLAILDFLGVASGAIAITKADLVEPDWLALVMEDVLEWVEQGTTRWEPPVAVSARTGQGLDDFKASLERVARGATVRDADDLFRMPVDRVFSVAGAGTVVTGTTWSGSVRGREEVRILPSGAKGRVRSIEVHGQPSERAFPGRRTALAIAGVSRGVAERGSTVVTDDRWRETRRLDVLVSLLPSAKPLTQRSRVRLHLGTAEVLARVTPAADAIEPGSRGTVRLRLESPVVARWGDRGVIRSYSPVTTVGGCVVIDPIPDPRPRRPDADPNRMSAEPLTRVEAFVRGGSRGLAVAELPLRLGIGLSDVAGVVERLPEHEIVRIGDRLYPAARARRAESDALEAVACHHEAFPLQPGLPLGAFRKACGGDEMAEHVRSVLEAQGTLQVHGGAVRLAEHDPALEGANAKGGAQLHDLLVTAGPHGLTLAEIQQQIDAASAVELAEHFVRTNTAVRVGSDRYYGRVALDEVVATVVRYLSSAESSTPAEFRELLWLSSKYLIPLLEWMDSQGITVRAGDGRRLGPKAPVKP
jgi:selenocysteine-specific elongation factor